MNNIDENEEVSEKVNEHNFSQDQIQPNWKRHRMIAKLHRDYSMYWLFHKLKIQWDFAALDHDFVWKKCAHCFSLEQDHSSETILNNDNNTWAYFSGLSNSA